GEGGPRGRGGEERGERGRAVDVLEVALGGPGGEAEFGSNQALLPRLADTGDPPRGLPRRQRADEVDHVPAVVLRQRIAEARHALPEAMGEPPEHVARRVVVRVRRGEIGGPGRQPPARGGGPPSAPPPAAGGAR